MATTGAVVGVPGGTGREEEAAIRVSDRDRAAKKKAKADAMAEYEAKVHRIDRCVSV